MDEKGHFLEGLEHVSIAFGWGEVTPPKLVYEVGLIPGIVTLQTPEGTVHYQPPDLDLETLRRVTSGAGTLWAHEQISLYDADGARVAGASLSDIDNVELLANLLTRITLHFERVEEFESFRNIVWDLMTAEKVMANVKGDSAPIYRNWVTLVSEWCAHLCARRGESIPAWKEHLRWESWYQWYVARLNQEKPFGPTGALEEIIFEADRHQLRELLGEVRRATTPREKKESLERLVTILLGWVVGLSVSRNMLSATGEIDVVVRNSCSHPTLKRWGDMWLVEAKNWRSKVGTDELGTFLTDLRETGCTTGLMFARSGISGRVGRYAWQRVFNAYARDGIVVMVVTEQDLDTIAHGENLVMMLIEKHENVRLGRVS